MAGVAAAVRLKYIAVITHGALLTPGAGMLALGSGDQPVQHVLDFPDARHDRARAIPGLTARIFDTIPRMQAHGIDGIRFNTVIKNDNLDDLVPLVHRAASLGVGVAFSVYTPSKNGNDAHRIPPERWPQLDAVIASLLAYKRGRRGVIVGSDHYLRQVPRWVRGR